MISVSTSHFSSEISATDQKTDVDLVVPIANIPEEHGGKETLYPDSPSINASVEEYINFVEINFFKLDYKFFDLAIKKN